MKERKERELPPATVRMEAARRMKRAQITENIMLVSLLTRFWPSHLTEPRKPQVNFQWIVCVHSPAGQLVWRVMDEELPLFDHLARGENHGKDYIGGDKEALLLLMATTSDWTMG